MNYFSAGMVVGIITISRDDEEVHSIQPIQPYMVALWGSNPIENNVTISSIDGFLVIRVDISTPAPKKLIELHMVISTNVNVHYVIII